MVAVWTVTGMAMSIGKARLDPAIPTLFRELPREVEFQAVNLRIEEVSGPDAPTIAGRPYRDEEGETIGEEGREDPESGEAVSPEEHAAVVEERDGLKADLDAITAASATKEQAQQAEVLRLQGELTRAGQTLAQAKNANKAALDKAATDNTAAIAKLNGDHENALRSLSDEKQAQIDALNAELSRANVELSRVNAELEAAKKP